MLEARGAGDGGVAATQAARRQSCANLLGVPLHSVGGSCPCRTLRKRDINLDFGDCVLWNAVVHFPCQAHAAELPGSLI